ncbi:MAG: hypothetical protein AABX04_07910 [Nanoarchaeota archaeon]
MVIKAVEGLGKSTKTATEFSAADFKFVKELIVDLDRIKTEAPDKASRDLRQGLRLLRWVGRGERKVDRAERRILEELEELDKILPTDLKREAEQLYQQMKIVEGQVLKKASLFRGNVKKEFSELKTEEDLARRYAEKGGEELARVKKYIVQLVEQTKDEVQRLRKWIESTEAVLRESEQFYEELMKLSR